MESMPPNSDRVATELFAQGYQSAVLGVFVMEQAGARETFALMQGIPPAVAITVGDWNITCVSEQSPIGRRLQEATLADEVMVRTPGGEFCAEIVSVDGCPIVSPQERLRIRKQREEERQALLAARWNAEQVAHQRRLQEQEEKATIAELKRRRQERDRLWRQQLASR